MDYAHLFNLYTAASRDALIAVLTPCVRMWTSDVLRNTSQTKNLDWRDELVQIGLATLIAELDSRLASMAITSGKHLVYSLRLPVKAALENAYDDLLGTQPPSRETRRRRRAKNLPEFQPEEKHRRVPLVGEYGHKISSRERNVPHEFLAKDNESDRYQTFIELAMKAAETVASAETRSLVCQIVTGAARTVAEAARQVGVKRTTAYSRLRQLGPQIAAAAGPELRELMAEFMPNALDVAADNRRGRSKSPRARAAVERDRGQGPRRGRKQEKNARFAPSKRSTEAKDNGRTQGADWPATTPDRPAPRSPSRSPRGERSRR